MWESRLSACIDAGLGQRERDIKYTVGSPIARKAELERKEVATALSVKQSESRGCVSGGLPRVEGNYLEGELMTTTICVFSQPLQKKVRSLPYES